MWKLNNSCRACGNTDLKEVFSLGVVPLANSFRASGEEQDGYVPLTVMFCPVCTLAQLRETVNPEVLYHSYPYTTSRTDTMRAHFEWLIAAIKEECTMESVLEIGSNDGYFLRLCRDCGADNAVGIDPAQNIQPDYAKTGVISICGLFGNDTIYVAHTAIPEPSVVVAANVFAHVDDWHAFIKHLDLICTKDTLVVLVVGSQLEMLKKVQFDSIYHEHLSYVSIASIQALLEHTPFHIHKVETVPLHGGSLVIMLRRNDCAKYPNPIPEENITEDMWSYFKFDVLNNRTEPLIWRVNELKVVGQKVAGYGAPAKSTVWINACGFTSKDIAFCVDGAKEKQGKLVPGTDIPILPESELAKADTAIVWAHNYFDEIVAKHKDSGITFINPHAL